MTIFCISCPLELPDSHTAAVKHFAERDVSAKFVNGIHGERFGILAWRPYRQDHPTRGSLINISQVGLALTHYMVWNICLHFDDDVFLILEDDAEFSENWKERLNQALLDAPDDWDIIQLGGTHCFDKPQTHIAGELFEVKYPFCTHAYMVNRKALEVLILNMRDAAMHIDIGLIEHAYPKLKVLTVLPRICNQRGNDLLA